MKKIDPVHLENLAVEARVALDCMDDERIHYLRVPKWITYPKAKEVLDSLDRHLSMPKSDRMPSILLVGNTNNGKSSIISKFLSMHEPELTSISSDIPIISIQAPFGPDTSALLGKILHKLSIPYKNGDKTAKKEEMVTYYFSLCNVKMLIVDEIHNILSGTLSKQKMFMNALKNLSNELKIPIVLVGTIDALHATNTDAQINNRFKPIHLPKWELNSDFVSLLASFEKTLPLKKASLLGQTKETAVAIYTQSDGYLGEIAELLTLAAEYSIKTGSEKITKEEVMKCGFVRPSMRKNFSDMVNL